MKLSTGILCATLAVFFVVTGCEDKAELPPTPPAHHVYVGSVAWTVNGQRFTCRRYAEEDVMHCSDVAIDGGVR